MTKLSVAIVYLNSPINFGLNGNQNADLDKYPESSYIKTMTKVANESRVEIIYFRSSMEIWGLRPNIKTAYKRLTEIDWVQSKLKEIVFQIELREDDREFIKGKRDGKLTKITNLTHCSWTMHESHNGYNFLMDIKDYPSQNPLMTFGLFEVLLLKLISRMSFPQKCHSMCQNPFIRK